jgi:hypothetical protein
MIREKKKQEKVSFSLCVFVRQGKRDSTCTAGSSKSTESKRGTPLGSDSSGERVMDKTGEEKFGRRRHAYFSGRSICETPKLLKNVIMKDGFQA